MKKINYQPFGELLKRVVDNRGKTCPTSDRGIPLIATNCILNTQLYPQHLKVRFVDDVTYKNWFRGHPDPGDMIFVTKGSPGRVAWVPDPVGFCIAQDMVAITADESKVYPKYLFAALRSKSIQYEIQGLHVGTLIPHFKKGDFNDLYIPIPNSEDQLRIGNMYFDLSLKIDLLHRQNKTLEAMAETLFRQWFVEEAKEDWEEVSLGEIAVIQNGFSFKSSSYVEQEEEHLEVFKMGHIEPGGGLRYSPKRNFVPRTERLLKWVLTKDDIVMAMTDMKDSMGILGHPAMIDQSNKYVLNQRVARIYLKDDAVLINNHFLYLQMCTDEAISIIQSKAHGGVQVNLSTETIRSTPVLVPPLNIQEDKWLLIEPLMQKQSHNRESIFTLENLRDTLLPKLMSGEVRVKMNEQS